MLCSFRLTTCFLRFKYVILLLFCLFDDVYDNLIQFIC